MRLQGMRREEEEKMHGPEGETETPETRVVSDGVEGVYVDLNGECHHEREQKNRRRSDAPGEECEEIKSPKRKNRVESAETQD